MRVPPLWVRRAVLAPAVVALAVVMLIGTPLWLLLALALASLVPGFLRVPRVLWLVTVYLLWEAAVLVVMFALWCASGFGWRIRSARLVGAHYVVARYALGALLRVFGLVLRLEVVTAGDDGDDLRTTRHAFNRLFVHDMPLVVASRHGGPGDSFVLMHVLLNQVRRQPRIVLKDTLQWDPAIDVLLRRIPTRFVTPSGFARMPAGGGSGVEEQIGELAADLDGDDALVIFPEGGQVSSRRRRARIARLRESGYRALAERAEGMRHVMPPQPGGVYAALAAAPDADMVFIGHTGLDRLQTVADVWRELPMGKRLTMRAWRVPRDRIPEARDVQAEWLFDWFESIDGWIAEHNREIDAD